MKTIALALIFLMNSTPQCLKVDLLLIGDMSPSVDGNQKQMAQAFSEFINKYELSDDGIRMGIVTFNSGARTNCALTSDKKKLIRCSDSIATQRTAGNTYMEEAFNTALDQFSSNIRRNAKRMMIVVSDGAVDHDMLCLMIAKSIKNNGIKICSVLILDNTPRPDFMKDISSDCYLETDYGSLHDEMAKLNVCI